jgi:hypothetical protein
LSAAGSGSAKGGWRTIDCFYSRGVANGLLI